MTADHPALLGGEVQRRSGKALIAGWRDLLWLEPGKALHTDQRHPKFTDAPLEGS